MTPFRMIVMLGVLPFTATAGEPWMEQTLPPLVPRQSRQPHQPLDTNLPPIHPPHRFEQRAEMVTPLEQKKAPRPLPPVDPSRVGVHVEVKGKKKPTRRDRRMNAERSARS